MKTIIKAYNPEEIKAFTNASDFIEPEDTVRFSDPTVKIYTNSSTVPYLKEIRNLTIKDNTISFVNTTHNVKVFVKNCQLITIECVIECE